MTARGESGYRSRSKAQLSRLLRATRKDTQMKPFVAAAIVMTALWSEAPGQSSAVDPNIKQLAGVWKANLSKSQRHPNHLFQSATLKFEVTGDVIVLTYSGVNMSGEQESGTTELHPDGKEHPMREATGLIEVTKWSEGNSLETVVKQDGKVVGQSSYEISSDRKTLTARLKGIDASGAAFEQIIAFER